jgi:hypothetical protein
MRLVPLQSLLLKLGVWVKLVVLHFLVSLSLIRVTLLFAGWLMPSWHRCTHVSDWPWRASLWDARFVAQQPFSAFPQTSSGEGRSRSGWALGGCIMPPHLLWTEFSAINPHAVQQNSKFSR